MVSHEEEEMKQLLARILLIGTIIVKVIPAIMEALTHYENAQPKTDAQPHSKSVK